MYIYISIYRHAHTYMHVYAHIHTHTHWPIAIMVRVFAYGPGVRGSGFSPRSSHTKDLKKIVVDISLLKSRHYKAWIKGKWSNLGKELAPSLTDWCHSYWKGTFGLHLTTISQQFTIYTYIYEIIWIQRINITSWFFCCFFCSISTI